MFKSIIFLVGFMLCGLDTAYAEEPPRASAQEQPTAVAQKESAASEPIPDIDALAELGKLSEGDILIIEYSLAALYYYPNELTGKPSQKLAEAIKHYKKDRPYPFRSVDGLLTDRQIDELKMNSSSADIGGIISPGSSKKILVYDNGNRVEAAGLWYSEESMTPPNWQDFERIVCFKDQGNCFSSSVSAVSDSGASSYSTTLYFYKILDFDNKMLVAKSIRLYATRIGDGDNSECNQKILMIDFDKKIGSYHVQRNPEKSLLGHCKGLPPVKKQVEYTLMNGLSDIAVNHYKHLKDVIGRTPTGQKEQLMKLIDAMESRAVQARANMPLGLK